MSTSTSPRRGLVSLLAAAALTAGVLAVGSPAQADPGPPPSSMASMGDSITRGFNACGFYFDCTSRSFSTGSDSGVNSHYLRIRAKNSAINGKNYNQGASGAKADDMPGQATATVGRNPQYVTILIGANDACTSSESLDDRRGHVPRAHRHGAGHPQERPAERQGRRRQHSRTSSGSGRSAGPAAPPGRPGRCSASASRCWPTRPRTPPPTSQRRDRVRQRVVDFNAQLAAACAAYGPNCDFDGNAVFNYPFSFNQVSGWDYFHPNTAGQAALAQVSYAAGFNW